MRKAYIIAWCLFLVIMLLAGNIFAQQVKEEKEEKALEETSQVTKSYSHNLSWRVRIMSGYDTNANLSPLRKGDIFEEVLFSLDFSKPLPKNIKFTFDYDLDILNYGEFIHLSNILNHFRLGAHKQFSPFTIGAGYDLGIFSYIHNDESNFIFRKGFFYLRQDISNKLYHQIQFEGGVKDYSKKKALGYTINSYLDKERLDKRLNVEYSIAAFLTPRLLTRFRTKFIINDSNARYLDFYDYKAWQESLNVDYKLLRDLYLFSSFTYTRKKYDDRTVTLATYKQKDNLYTGTLGLMYRFNKNNSLSLSYTYRENSSNEHLEEYSQSMISCGWQYNF